MARKSEPKAAPPPPPEAEPARTTAHHAIVRLRVSGGFLAEADLTFADGLNCLIGGRGTGKTTALELLRFGLGLMPDPKTNPQRHRAIDTLVKSNLGGGRLSVEVRTKTAMRYTAERSATEAVQVLNETGTAVPVSLDRDLIFGADVFSQNEVEEIASNPSSQLLLLDRFVENETATIARELETLRRQLEQTGADLSRLDRELDDLAATASEVPVLEERLKGLAQAGGPDAAILTKAHAAKALRAREASVIDQLIADIGKAAGDSKTIAGNFAAAAEARLDHQLRGGINAELIAKIEEQAQTFARVLIAQTEAIAAAAKTAVAQLEKQRSPLAEKHATQEAEYRKVVSKSEEAGGKATERTALQANLTAAINAAREKEAKDKHRAALAAQRRTLLTRVSELRDQRFAARKKVAEQLTQRFGGTIRVSVLQSADLQQYKNLIAEALKGSGMKHGMAAERLTQSLSPAELARAVAAKDHATIAEKAGQDEERAKKILETLRTSGAIYAIDSVELDDLPRIELRDGESYKDSPNLSTGQRCTTILPILLVQSERPLLIDQPEDNLDNAFIYETIVKALRAAKGTRQIIFVTHNPNIPVLGEAERIFVLHSDGKRGTVRHAGTVDECKDYIETILEGGREAFLRRKERYGH